MGEWTKFDVEKLETIVVAKVTESELLDTIDIEQFRAELLRIIGEANDDTVVLDFSELSRGSTAVINNLLLAKKQLLGNGGDLFLCNLQDAIRHTLRILNLEGTVFEVFETRDLAIQELAQRNP